MAPFSQARRILLAIVRTMFVLALADIRRAPWTPPRLQILSFSCSFYHPKTKFTKVMFSQVSFCLQGVSSTHTPLRADNTTLGRHPPPLGRHPPPPSVCWDTVNKLAVRIPLECILAWNKFAK